MGMVAVLVMVKSEAGMEAKVGVIAEVRVEAEAGIGAEAEVETGAGAEVSCNLTFFLGASISETRFCFCVFRVGFKAEATVIAFDSISTKDVFSLSLSHILRDQRQRPYTAPCPPLSLPRLELGFGLGL